MFEPSLFYHMCYLLLNRLSDSRVVALLCKMFFVFVQLMTKSRVVRVCANVEKTATKHDAPLTPDPGLNKAWGPERYGFSSLKIIISISTNTRTAVVRCCVSTFERRVKRHGGVSDLGGKKTNNNNNNNDRSS